MKYIQNILLLFFGIVAFTTISCSEDDKNFGDTCNVRLTLQISRQEGNGTRATDPGVDTLNENALKTVDLFFYKKGAAITDAPVFFATDIQLPAGRKTQSEVSVSMPLDAFSELFPTDADTECLVYAIANRPTSSGSDNALPSDKSIASLKDTTILYAPDFAVREEDSITHKYSPKVQDDFVMDGQATVTRAGDNLTGNIPIERVAAKITLIINGIADEVTDNYDSIWCSDKDNVALCLRRASVRTKLGSTPDEYIYSANKDADIFRLDGINLTSAGTTLTTEVPFYTYPTNWKNDENSRTHFILIVNWKLKNNPSKTKITYYEININPAGSYTRRNSHYKIYQEVGVLGSESQEKPFVLYPCNYVILDWGNTHEGTADTDSDANLNRFKYLVVDETTIEMENTSSKEIFFFSSDPIELTTFDAKWEYTGGNTSQTLQLATEANITSTTTDPVTGDITYTIANTNDVTAKNASNQNITIPNRIQGNDSDPNHDYRVKIIVHNANPDDPNDRSYIYFQHNLNNNMDKDADYTEYTFTFGVQHKGNDKYKDEIKITQYPMIAIKADLNSDYNDKSSSYNDTSDKDGYVYLNKGNTDGLGSISGLSGNNSNPNRYIISVTALDNSSYIIGDPRSVSDNNLNWTSSSAITMEYSGDTNERKLSYYHPTDETSRTSRMVSPQFMIASSYGKTTTLDLEHARRRCAAYQEDGYPAGRWRIPTQAEIEYIVQLSAWGVIPVLFGTAGSSSGTTYWSANGAIQVFPALGTAEALDNVDSGDEYYTRCVYDTWYWTDKCTKTQFTWGDKADF
ncbi:MAG: hypothetical protein IJC08_05610 [Bacteroidaceae bacterium]|nr:hypothetical protein [Bacteroidaceae bacterium]